MFLMFVLWEKSYSVFLVSGLNAVAWFGRFGDVFVLDDEKIILSLEFSDERDFGNCLDYWVRVYEDMSWLVLVILLISEVVVK